MKYRKYRTLQFYYFHVFLQTRSLLASGQICEKRLVSRHAENPLRARAPRRSRCIGTPGMDDFRLMSDIEAVRRKCMRRHSRVVCGTRDALRAGRASSCCDHEPCLLRAVSPGAQPTPRLGHARPPAQRGAHAHAPAKGEASAARIETKNQGTRRRRPHSHARNLDGHTPAVRSCRPRGN